MARESMDERLTSLGSKVQKLRDKGDENSKWGAIASALGTSQGKCMLAYLFVTTAEKDRIKFKTDEDLAAKIVKGREAGLSWGVMSARSGVPESKVRRLWEQTTGKSTRGERIGKGGRHPGEANTTAKAKGAAKPVAKSTKTKAQQKAAEAKAKAPKVTKTAAKANGAAKKTTAKTAAFDFKSADLDMLTERLEGRKLKVLNSVTKKEQVVAVKTVKNADDKNIEIIDAKTSGSRTFARSAIVGATR